MPNCTRDVVGGRHDAAPLRIAADDQRLLAQLGILELFDRRIEGVEIEVGDDAWNGHTNNVRIDADGEGLVEAG